jgi:hypothetical protein
LCKFIVLSGRVSIGANAEQVNCKINKLIYQPFLVCLVKELEILAAEYEFEYRNCVFCATPHLPVLMSRASRSTSRSAANAAVRVGAAVGVAGKASGSKSKQMASSQKSELVEQN